MLLDDLMAASRQGKIGIEPFFLGFSWNPFAASATTPKNATIDNDSDFVIRYQMLSAYSDGNVLIPDPDYLAVMVDSSSGRNFQNIAQHVRNSFGVAQRPFILSEPKLMHGGGVITITLQNLTAVAARVEIALHGLKVYYYEGFRRENLGRYL